MLKKIHVIGLAAICLGLILFGIFPRTTFAANFYVDGTSGTDQPGCGNVQGASACRTIQYAIDAAADGDTISITGSFDENLNFGTKNLVLDGNNSTTLTDTSRPGASDTGLLQITGGQTSTTVIRRLTINASSSTPEYGIKTSGTSYPTLEYLTVQGATNTGIYIGAASTNERAVVRNNTVTGNTFRGIYVWESQALIDSNRVTGSSAIFFYNADNTSYVVNNVISGGGNEGGISVRTGGSNNTTLIIANNTLYNNSTGKGIQFDNDNASHGTVAATIKNNLIVNQATGIYVDNTGGKISLVSNYNLFYPATSPSSGKVGQDESPAATYTTLAAWQARAGSPDANSWQADPQFTNVAGNDVTLQNASPAIGTGTDDIVGSNDLATYSLTQDFSDNLRPNGTKVDLGAHENQTMGDLQSISVTGTSFLDASVPFSALTATGTYSAGPPQNFNNLVTWNSSDTNKVVVSASGMARGMGTGTSDVTASYIGVTSNPLSIATTGMASYVSIYADANSGNDSTGNGTSAAPYQTLSKGLSELPGGGRLYLKGTFTGSLSLTTSHSGTADNNTWITNQSGQSATIDVNGASSTHGINLNGTDYLTIQGLTITGATASNTSAVYLRNTANNITVNNNVLHDNVFGIYEDTSTASGSSHVFSNNTLYDNDIGIVMANSTSDSVFNNLIYENNGPGAPNGTYNMGILFFLTTDTTGIWNNTFASNPGGAINAFNIGYGDPTVTNLTVKNNIFYEVVSGIRLAAGVSGGIGNVFDYNLYYTVNNAPIMTAGGTNYSSLAAWQAASAHDDNSVGANPLFTNLAADDYTLSSSSPAMNMGTSNGAPSGASTDFAGTVRVAGYDIGAYEVPLTAPTAASGLAASGITTNGLALSWTDNSSGTGAEDNFVVKYSTTSASAGFDTTVAMLSPNTTSVAVTSLTAGTNYWFMVQATNAAGTSSSAALAATTTSAGSARHSGSASENSNGTASPAADSPASLQRSMSSFTHALALLRFMISLPSGSAAGYLDFNNDGLFDTRDLRLFLNTRRGR